MPPSQCRGALGEVKYPADRDDIREHARAEAQHRIHAHKVAERLGQLEHRKRRQHKERHVADKHRCPKPQYQPHDAQRLVHEPEYESSRERYHKAIGN
ncbi:MAG: DUF2795 domain-containing protein [Oscillospiraceae bacterium]|nr:DUF2795 domain-containing protein [Oscillospiraceae bacterium]